MILVGNPRGGAKDLARHLTKDENDHVTVHELRGFTSDTLDGALTEAYAVSRGTQCKQFLFSLSLNPPPDAEVSTESFESAIDRVEGQLDLDGQPRAVVFHEKDGRRHAHAVWSRIDAETMTAKQLSWHKNKLQDVSRELYLEHGWRMPEGFADRSKSDPRNFTLEEWQQAKRKGRDPREIKDAFRDAWAISDSKAAFEHALKERGYWLARGDRRGFTALDAHGEVYAVAKWAGVKTKAVREKLGNEDDLPSLADTKAKMAGEIDGMLSRLRDEQYEEAAALKAQHNQQKHEMLQKQRAERAAHDRTQRHQQEREQAERQARFRKGLAGLWDRVRGEHRRLTEQNRMEALAAQRRDRNARDKLIFEQVASRRTLTLEASKRRQEIAERQKALQADKERYAQMAKDKEEFVTKRRKRQAQAPAQPRAPPDQDRTSLKSSFNAEAEPQAIGRNERRQDFMRARGTRTSQDRDDGHSRPEIER